MPARLLGFARAALGDLVAPLRCAACDEKLRTRSLLCRCCADTVERWRGPDDPWAYARFGGALAQALRRLKYGARPDLGESIGQVVAAALPPCDIDLVVPVPVPYCRLVERGYNQAALIARPIATRLGRRLEPLALWRAEGVKQASLGREERLANVRGALAVRRPQAVRGRRVLLIDDVSTTGATVQACRSVLLEAGARGVCAMVVARAGSPLEGSASLDAYGTHEVHGGHLW